MATPIDEATTTAPKICAACGKKFPSFGSYQLHTFSDDNGEAIRSIRIDPVITVARKGKFITPRKGLPLCPHHMREVLKVLDAFLMTVDDTEEVS